MITRNSISHQLCTSICPLIVSLGSEFIYYHYFFRAYCRPLTTRLFLRESDWPKLISCKIMAQQRQRYNLLRYNSIVLRLELNAKTSKTHTGGRRQHKKR